MSVITIDLNQVAKWVENSEKMVLTPEAEESLKQLLDLQNHIDEAVKTAKARIEKEALDYNPNFTGLKTDKFKITYRAYGGRYKINPDYVGIIPDGLYKTSVRYTPDTKAIDKWQEENEGLMPEGIEEVERVRQISVKEIENE